MALKLYIHTMKQTNLYPREKQNQKQHIHTTDVEILPACVLMETHLRDLYMAQQIGLIK